MTKSQIRREAEQAVQEASAKAAADIDSPENAAPPEPATTEVLPDGVRQYDVPPPQAPVDSLVTITPTSSAQVTVPSGASFSLQPGTPLTMKQSDAQYLADSGLVG